MHSSHSLPDSRVRTLIRGARVYDHDGDTDAPADRDVLVDGGDIMSVSAPGQLAPGPGDEVLDAHGCLLVPGFFNAHYHSHDTLLRGCFETPSLDFWGLLGMPPSYPRRSREELRLRTLAGAIECLRAGITTIQDMNTLVPFDEDDLDVVISAYEELGIRCVLAPQFTNQGRMKARVFYEELIPEAERWRLAGPQRQFPEGTAIVERLRSAIRTRRDRSGLITFALGPSSPETVTRDVWEAIAEASRDDDLPVYTHVYENRGMTHIAREAYAANQGSLIHWLAEIGALDSRISFAHSVWMRDDEIEAIARAGAHVVLNPVGNLKTHSGIAPIREMLSAGVNVALGCDNCSCTDVQNMFQSMKAFAALPAICHLDDGPPRASDAMRAATLAGARTAGRDDLGAIRAGMRADIVVIDLDDPAYLPLNSVARQLVYSECGRGVRDVMVDGRLVVREGRVTTVDVAAIRAEVRATMPALLADLETVRERIGPLAPMIREAERRTSEADLGVRRTLIGLR